MEESILLITHIHKGGIQAGHQFLDFRQVYVAHGIGEVPRFFLKRHEPRVFKKREGHFVCLYVDDEFAFHTSWGRWG